MSTTHRFTSLSAAVAACGALAAIGLAPGSASAASTTTTSSDSVRSAPRITADAWAAGRKADGPDATEQEAIAAFWTPERMRAAKEADAPAGTTDTPPKAAASARRKSTARKVFKVGPVRGKLDRTARSAAYNPNLPFSAPTAYTNGKLFFTRNGVAKVCSGAIVNTEGKDTVWTAGHCLHSGGGAGVWSANVAFVPAYDDDLANPRPYGTWTASRLYTRTSWINSMYVGEDMGVAIMNTNFGGWHIVDYFGGHGFLANLSKYLRINMFGYPQSAPFDGGNLWACEGDAQPKWDYGTISSDQQRMVCDMTGGSSGGPWLWAYNGQLGYLNGVTSTGTTTPGWTYSPYFGNNAQSLYNDTRYL